MRHLQPQTRLPEHLPGQEHDRERERDKHSRRHRRHCAYSDGMSLGSYITYTVFHLTCSQCSTYSWCAFAFATNLPLACRTAAVLDLGGGL